MKKKIRRVMAVIAIILLLSMYLINLVLALIGSEWAQEMLKLTMVMSIMIPILLYAFLMIMKRNDNFPTSYQAPEIPDDLSGGEDEGESAGESEGEESRS